MGWHEDHPRATGRRPTVHRFPVRVQPLSSLGPRLPDVAPAHPMGRAAGSIVARRRCRGQRRSTHSGRSPRPGTGRRYLERHLERPGRHRQDVEEPRTVHPVFSSIDPGLPGRSCASVRGRSSTGRLDACGRSRVACPGGRPVHRGPDRASVSVRPSTIRRSGCGVERGCAGRDHPVAWWTSLRVCAAARSLRGGRAAPTISATTWLRNSLNRRTSTFRTSTVRTNTS